MQIDSLQEVHSGKWDQYATPRDNLPILVLFIMLAVLYFKVYQLDVLTIDIVGGKSNAVADALDYEGQGQPAMEDAKCPVAPSRGVDEDVGSSTEKKDEWQFGCHEDTESISENSADLSWNSFIADGHVRTLS